ncbi:hypothetical protein GW17_00045925, partial [Ensete ventricosum]
GQTIQMMYEIVAQALKSMNLENAHPQDYLNFYCLGNREEAPKDNLQQDDQSLEKIPEKRRRRGEEEVEEKKRRNRRRTRKRSSTQWAGVWRVARGR